MRTIYDAKDILVKRLLETVKGDISGNIYRDRRPTGSRKEDIVVNSLPLTADHHQIGRLNVNVYVPFLSVNIEDTQQDQPNTPRLKELAKKLTDVLNNIYGSDNNFYIEFMQDFEEQAEKANYINFRIRINLFNQ